MNYLSEFLNVVGITCLLLGLLIAIFPAMFKNKKTGKLPNRKITLLRAVCGAVLCFVISAIISP